jgi:acyl-coenzyme A synthetase/AMP-(fatty) acid ligase
MLGYWRAPELTKKRFREWGPGSERVLFTGDLCSIDSGGYLYFHGRMDDTYKQRGFRVGPAEVEEAACAVDGVHEAALLPPNGSAGAVLFVRTDLAEREVLAALRDRLEDFKLPEKVIAVDTIRRNANGKVDRERLRQLL